MYLKQHYVEIVIFLWFGASHTFWVQDIPCKYKIPGL